MKLYMCFFYVFFICWTQLKTAGFGGWNGIVSRLSESRFVGLAKDACGVSWRKLAGTSARPKGKVAFTSHL